MLLTGAPGALESMSAEEVAGWILSGDAEVAATLHAGECLPAGEEAGAAPSGFLDTLSAQG